MATLSFEQWRSEREAQASSPKDLVQNIAKSHGHLSESVYAKMDPDMRREVEEAMLKKDEMIGSSVIALAKNLYSKDVRFIFELLQNADDNSFRFADSSDKIRKPYISFQVHEDRIVVDCNEDGFTEEHLEAICSIGKSSKKGAQGYIGEKGICFKSVFTVASKVHIQSGNFSFSFKHSPGDSDGDSETQDRRRKSIKDQLRDLQPAMLLFLKQLKRIEVVFFNAAGEETSSVVREIAPEAAPGVITLKEVRSENGRHTDGSTEQHYFVRREEIIDVPKSENREYSVNEENSKAYATVEIVLAFPLSGQFKPIIEPQDIFAFLPIRKVGFNFLIHTDFVTLANREDISSSSPRNETLLLGIAIAFCSAVKNMMKGSHQTLRFQWMRYLPDTTGNMSQCGSFWRTVVVALQILIRKAEVLLSGGELYVPQQLRCVPPRFRDEQGHPLFLDLPAPDTLYLNEPYKRKDVEILRGYGLKELTGVEMLHWVRADLNNDTSRMKSADTTYDWHSRAANLLRGFLDEDNSTLANAVKELEVLPLADGRWIRAQNSATDNPVYFPETSEGLPIPPDLQLPVKLSLVHQSVVAHPLRKQLFDDMGVQTTSSENIRALIFKYFASPTLRRRSSTLGASRSTLWFLYLTDRGHSAPTVYNDVTVADSDFLLLKSIPYFSDAPPEKPPSEAGLSWKAWLCQKLKLRRDIRLVARDDDRSLSEELLIVAEEKPSKLLGLLKHLWPSEGSSIENSDHLRDQLGSLPVLCEESQVLPLKGTFLPLNKLKRHCYFFMVEGEKFLFLQLEYISGSGSEWQFLDGLGVGMEENLLFDVTTLNSIINGNANGQIVNSSRLIPLYQGIYSKLLTSEMPAGDTEYIKDQFAANNAIYVPNPPENEWTQPSICVLHGPDDMEAYFRIDTMYKKAFAGEDKALPKVMKVFETILDIPICTWSHHLYNLQYLKENGYTDKEFIKRRYEILNGKGLDVVRIKETRDAFEEDALILISSAGEATWHKPSGCIWSTASEIRGKVNLTRHYDPELEGFFLDVLGVSKLNITMVFDELMAMRSGVESIDKTKDLLKTFNSLLGSDKLLKDQRPKRLLHKHPNLPLRGPGLNERVRLEKASAEFVIVDRKQLGALFSTQIKTFDFDLQDVRELEPFIQWAGLSNRYLSTLVKNTTVLGSGKKQPVSEPCFNIRRKAHGLVRIATHFKSPRVTGNGQTLYELLISSETWESDGISSELSLRMNDTEITATVEQSEVHVKNADNTEPLKFYIPIDEETRDVCIQHALPKKLIEWMMTDPTKDSQTVSIDQIAVGAVKSLLNCRIASVSKVLDTIGIVDIAVKEVQFQDEPATQGAVVVSKTIKALLDTEMTSKASSQAGMPWQQDLPFRFSSSGLIPRASPSRQEEVRHNLLQVAQSSDEYRKFLSHIIAAAENYRGLPSGRIESVSENEGKNGSVVPFSHRALFGSFSQPERDLLVGAAGELYIFEILSSILPNFSLANWKSTIRKYATAHPKYAEMAPWRGMETADLEYHDTDGTLTDLLSRGGYAIAETHHSNIKYYLEVKPTSGEFDNPFYMSGHQYKNIKKYSKAPGSMYIVLRVHSMYTPSINVRIYNDPVLLEREGVLEFSADKYTVQPGDGSDIVDFFIPT